MTKGIEGSSGAPRGLVIAAFAAIYLIWGSTYLAIRFAVESLPPFLLGGGRFLLAGLILYACLRFTGNPAPDRFHWWNATLVGAMLLGIGNGFVNWAERKVPSSLTALLIAATPLWFALLDWLRPRGQRPRLQTLLGIFIGFFGVALLVGSRESLRRNSIDAASAIALMAASFCWAAGSLYARYTPKPESRLMAVALQMIMGGLCLFLAGWVSGESETIEWAEISRRSAIAFLYLACVGSLVAFTAYSWLLRVSTPARISTYAYVNPVIAVFLGWAIGGETLTPRIVWAAAVIVLGVVIITTRTRETEVRNPALADQPVLPKVANKS